MNTLLTYFISSTCSLTACHLGIIPRVHRRLSDIERQCVRSGSVYCFDEREAGMRRWTDGKSWSPSRVTGSFLTYRELDDTHGTTSKNAYRLEGLFKQSFSITTSDNKKLHLISYYKNDDATSEGHFMAPSRDPRFAHIVIPKGIYPETDSYSQSHSASSTNNSSPSPPTRLRHRPHHRGVHIKDEDREVARRAESSPYAVAAAAASHRRTQSGSMSVKEQRYSPTPSAIDNSRSNGHHFGYSASSFDSYGSNPEKRYKSTSPMARSSFSTPPLNSYSSPTGSWVSDDEQPLVTDTITADPESLTDGASHDSDLTLVMVPSLQDDVFASRFDHHHKANARSFDYESYESSSVPPATPYSHEQDSLSVLADLATDTFLLPRPEPKEISGVRIRWVEDDRQLSAVSSMLRL